MARSKIFVDIYRCHLEAARALSTRRVVLGQTGLACKGGLCPSTRGEQGPLSCPCEACEARALLRSLAKSALCGQALGQIPTNRPSKLPGVLVTGNHPPGQTCRKFPILRGEQINGE